MRQLKDASPRAYNAALRSLAERRNWIGASNLLWKMRAWQPPPDIVNYTMALSACAKGIAWHVALAMHEHAMLGIDRGGAGLAPDARSFSATMQACAQAWQWKRAVELLQEMCVLRVQDCIVPRGAEEVLVAAHIHVTQVSQSSRGILRSVNSSSRGVMWRDAKALVCLMALESVWAAVEVTEVNASHFDPTENDVVFDVWNSDEYEGRDCSIGSADSLGCTYGHLSGTVWSPELHHCGARGPANFTCTTLL